jgi:hypothetical protein
MRLLLRVLAVLFVLYAVLSIVRAFIGGKGPRPVRAAGSRGRLMKDPVCGTYIPEETALRSADQFFCSEECLRKFSPNA